MISFMNFIVNISLFRFQEAKKKIEELYPSDISKFKFIEGNANNSLSFAENYFDTGVCIVIIEHIYVIFYLVKEMYKILKSKGYMIAEIPNMGLV